VRQPLKIGVMLRPGEDGTPATVREQARHAEALGLDGVFIGDHLTPARPYPESLVVLSAAAAATERLAIGVGVLVVALRDSAWAAKQLATLQHVSGGRLVLGIGTGGAVHGTAAWEAVGVPYAERGRRTDEALALLPRLIAGERVKLPSGATIALAPGAAVPPILVGGNSPAALRRAARHGAGWFPSMLPPHRVADGARALPPDAEIAVGGATLLDPAADDPRIAALVTSLVDGYGIAPEDANTVPIAGSPAEAAARFQAYTEAGASWLVLGTIDDDWRRQWERIAEARALLS
jgi:alkanesulfonate monooxygenase SsuD/methylene tetrahydromethanopterin reductase-like flavin-dependent oxidoreductase (luciferase family)